MIVFGLTGTLLGARARRPRDALESQTANRLYISSISQAEIPRGILRLPAGRRRGAIEAAAKAMFAEEFASSILACGSDAACPMRRSPWNDAGEIGHLPNSMGRSRLSRNDAIFAESSQSHDIHLARHDRINAIDNWPQAGGPSIRAVLAINPEARRQARALDRLYRGDGGIGGRSLHCIIETGLVNPIYEVNFTFVAMTTDPNVGPSAASLAQQAASRAHVESLMDSFVTPDNRTLRLDALLINPADDITAPGTCGFGSTTQMPSLVVPIGKSSDGVPKGIEFIARKWDEPTILGLAYDYEQATHHRVAPTLAANPLAGTLQLVLNDLDAAPLEETTQAVRKFGRDTVTVAGDITRPEFPQQVVDAALRKLGRLDIIVNNAGFTWDNVIQKMQDEQWQTILDVHLTAPFRILRAASAYIRDAAKKEREAGQVVFRKVVNISFISGMLGVAGQANYSSAKAGIIGLTKAMAKEWGRYHVNVNCVAFQLRQRPGHHCAGGRV